MWIFIFMLALLVVALGPLAVIWAINTLFALGIAYTLSTWLAMIVLLVAIGGISIKYNQ